MNFFRNLRCNLKPYADDGVMIWSVFRIGCHNLFLSLWAVLLKKKPNKFPYYLRGQIDQMMKMLNEFRLQIRCFP